ncbi:MAG: hypothetical protein ACI379_15115 [Nocardioides sp.]|uniref:hypothetical protein n=1 Tax=Nocardioides sp. TaxID=35761 RepID=UPI003F0AB7C7
MRHRLFSRAVPLALVAVLSLGACGSEGDDDTSDTSTTQGATLSLRVTEDGVTPNGELVKVGTGEEITVEIDADEAGSFHIHSTPEQEIEFDAGESTHTVSFDSPGKIEMESHDPSLVVAIFEVR